MENTRINLPIQSPPSLHKTCRKCGESKPATLEYFFKNAGGKYGLTPRCKPCVTADNKDWELRNPERVLANANKRSKKYYYNNLEKARKTSRESAAKAKLDPAKKLRIQTRKRGGNAKLTPEDIEAMKLQQNNQCAICLSPDPTDLDHCHTSKKVRWLLCKHCNRGLGAFRDDPNLLRKAASMLESIGLEDKPVSSISL